MRKDILKTNIVIYTPCVLLTSILLFILCFTEFIFIFNFLGEIFNFESRDSARVLIGNRGRDEISEVSDLSLKSESRFKKPSET